jgi:hypothetical protein
MTTELNIIAAQGDLIPVPSNAAPKEKETYPF